MIYIDHQIDKIDLEAALQSLVHSDVLMPIVTGMSMTSVYHWQPTDCCNKHSVWNMASRSHQYLNSRCKANQKS